MLLEGVLVPGMVMVGENMEIRNLGSDLISIMIISVSILVTITTLGSLTRAREQEARPACGSASSACTRVKLLCDLGGGMVILAWLVIVALGMVVLAVVNEFDVDGDLAGCQVTMEAAMEGKN